MLPALQDMPTGCHMQQIERRLAALEAKANDDSLKIVVVEDGGLKAAALHRAGLKLDSLGVVFVTALDLRL